MALNFPASPSAGDTYAGPNGVTYTFQGGLWVATGVSLAQVPPGSGQVFGPQKTIKQERFTIPAASEVSIANISGGPGVLTYLFFAISNTDSPAGTDTSLIKFYVDGEVTPSIETDVDGLLGTFYQPVYKSPLIGSEGLQNSGHGLGGYIYINVPFDSSLNITVTNGSATTDAFVASIAGYALGGSYNWDRYKRLHNSSIAFTNAMASVAPYAEHTLADVTGRGAYYGTMFFLISGEADWHPLEGNFKIYVDGEASPSWESSGTEDYFNGAYYFAAGAFAAHFSGAPLVDNTNHRLCAYRWHIPDPITFDTELKVTWTNGENIAGLTTTADSQIGGNIWYYLDS